MTYPSRSIYPILRAREDPSPALRNRSTRIPREESRIYCTDELGGRVKCRPFPEENVGAANWQPPPSQMSRLEDAIIPERHVDVPRQPLETRLQTRTHVAHEGGGNDPAESEGSRVAAGSPRASRCDPPPIVLLGLCADSGPPEAHADHRHRDRPRRGENVSARLGATPCSHRAKGIAQDPAGPWYGLSSERMFPEPYRDAGLYTEGYPRVPVNLSSLATASRRVFMSSACSSSIALIFSIMSRVVGSSFPTNRMISL